ncbi:MAG: NAD-dependent epimerase/dehydratase family protein [Opitutaceae bacterium]
MSERILITGGAGFIGSHLADELLRHGYAVRALDCLHPQVHGPRGKRPEYLDPDVELRVGDVRDPEAVRDALEGVTGVFHFAARVGVGQSMYQIADYCRTNAEGTAVLLEALATRPVRRLIMASSMSIYGEGLFRAPDGAVVPGNDRPLEQLQAREWELRDARGTILSPIPTPETKVPNLASVYALSKYDQERLCLLVGRAYRISTVALRFFNVYGPRQALSNPYTGVLAIFAARLLGGKRPMIFEDGGQQRDFIHVSDIARACRLALEAPAAIDQVFNIGSGRQRTVLQVAESLALALGRTRVEPEVTERYRAGDIRHCFADISLARRVLGFQPQVEFDAGLRDLVGWLEGQIAVDGVNGASAELATRGLTV